MEWLDALPWGQLLLIGGLLALAPFTPEPHLVEKIRMLSQGDLKKPVDIFDLLMHSAPLIVIAIKALRQFVFEGVVNIQNAEIARRNWKRRPEEAV